MVAEAGGDLPGELRTARASIEIIRDKQPCVAKRTRPRKPPIPFQMLAVPETLPMPPNVAPLPRGPVNVSAKL